MNQRSRRQQTEADIYRHEVIEIGWTRIASVYHSETRAALFSYKAPFPQERFLVLVFNETATEVQELIYIGLEKEEDTEGISPNFGFASLVIWENTSMPPMRAALDSRMMYKEVRT